MDLSGIEMAHYFDQDLNTTGKIMVLIICVCYSDHDLNIKLEGLWYSRHPNTGPSG
jgi:hypothetical protein